LWLPQRIFVIEWMNEMENIFFNDNFSDEHFRWGYVLH
jgi:hypothetical protein